MCSIINVVKLFVWNCYSRFLPDELYLNKLFKSHAGYALNLDNPQTFNEKLQWLKLHDRKPIYSVLVDKYNVKEYIAEKIGIEHVIPTLGIYNKFDEIDFNQLPNQFVLKCTHDSGGLAICRDAKSFNIAEARKKIEKSLKKNFYWDGREWPYKEVKPRIIAEKYMVDESGTELKDYKFFCFNGKPRFFKIDFNRYIDHHANYYTIEGDLMPFDEVLCPRDVNANIKFPENLNQMIEVASKLSEGIPFVRVDLYNINGTIYFGEMTFYPASGMGRFSPQEWDYKFGEMLQISI